ncbi:hypothetical protein SK128_000894 [Halocaridina rubra]|uniref:Uncharacterized protein n=1 Tax=Halocaridina rubra TaxID=373956 RepID=A0AAN9A7N9_HALRR
MMMVTITVVTGSDFQGALTSIAVNACTGKASSCRNKAESCARSTFMDANQQSDSLLTLEEVNELRAAFVTCALNGGFSPAAPGEEPLASDFTSAELVGLLDCAAKSLNLYGDFVNCVN